MKLYATVISSKFTYCVNSFLEARTTGIIYRGTRQSQEQLDKLKGCAGELITNKTFMSTSRSKAVALAFSSNDPSQTPDSRALLCEIHVNLDAPDIVAADVAQSGIRDEAEVLFDLGTVFRVIKFEYQSQDSTALCVLEATSDKPVFMRHTRKNDLRN
jgi:hypothetical protein